MTLVQVAVPSREGVPMYKELRRDVDETVGKINGEFSTPDWTPIVYLRRNLPRAELSALYALADVAWVAPLRDGFNLVAKEYVACQRGGEGVLVLSEFAGAAAEMGEALHRLIHMTRGAPPQPSVVHWRCRRRRNASAWRCFTSGSYTATSTHGASASPRICAEAATSRTARAAALPAELPAGDAAGAFGAAKSRLLLLDYDGTLVGYAKRPQDAVPPPDLIRLLEELARHPATDSRPRLWKIEG